MAKSQKKSTTEAKVAAKVEKALVVERKRAAKALAREKREQALLEVRARSQAKRELLAVQMAKQKQQERETRAKDMGRLLGISARSKANERVKAEARKAVTEAQLLMTQVELGAKKVNAAIAAINAHLVVGQKLDKIKVK